jgi:hypothetical protein
VNFAISLVSSNTTSRRGYCRRQTLHFDLILQRVKKKLFLLLLINFYRLNTITSIEKNRLSHMPPTSQVFMLGNAGWGDDLGTLAGARCAVLKHVLKVLPHYGILQSSGDTRAFLNTCSVSTASLATAGAAAPSR